MNGENENQPALDLNEELSERFGRIEMWAEELGITQRFIRQKLKGCLGITGRDKEGIVHKRAYYSESTIRRVLAGQLWPDFAERLKIWIENNPSKWEEMYNRVVSLSQSNTHDWYCNKRFYKITRWLEEQFVLHHSNALRPDQSEKILKLNSVFKFLKYKKIDWAMPDEFSLAEFLALHGRFPTSEEPKYSDEERTRKWIYTCGLLARKNRLPKIVRKNLAELGVHFLVLGETFTTRLIKPFDAQLCREES